MTTTKPKTKKKETRTALNISIILSCLVGLGLNCSLQANYMTISVFSLYTIIAENVVCCFRPYDILESSINFNIAPFSLSLHRIIHASQIDVWFIDFSVHHVRTDLQFLRISQNKDLYHTHTHARRYSSNSQMNRINPNKVNHDWIQHRTS